MQRHKSQGKGFTLIELLVVISIIALLASILLPSLTSARDMAKGAQCTSNMHNIGTSLLMYTADNQQYFPICDSYLNGTDSTGGYQHWSGSLNIADYSASPTYYATGGTDTNVGFPKASNDYVCPSQPQLGFAPPHFTKTRIANPPGCQISQSDFAGDDIQVARLSYVPNEAIMPPKTCTSAVNTGTDKLCQVNVGEISHLNTVILMGEYAAQLPAGTYSWPPAYLANGGVCGVVSSQAGHVFNSQNYTNDSSGGAVTLHKLCYATAQSDFTQFLAGTTGLDHITALNPAAHKSGSNYLFCDGHLTKFSLSDTLDQNNWMWGAKMYSVVDKLTVQDNTVAGTQSY